MNVVGTAIVGSACCWKELACPFVLLALLAPVLAFLPDSVRKLEILLETSCNRECHHCEFYLSPWRILPSHGAFQRQLRYGCLLTQREPQFLCTADANGLASRALQSG